MKILLATMSMDIGGAETHILELALELLKRGHEVHLVSNGGEYIPVLEKAGVKIFTAPLNSNHPIKMFKAYKYLDKLIKEQKYDLVHSHTRISSFLLGLLKKKYHYPYVTSDHGAFKVTPFLKAMTNWGEVTLAVSNDLKEYLIKNYNVPEDNIIVTVNGIDTEKFSKGAIFSDALKELNLEENSFRIVHVSRMDNETTFVTKQLIKITPKLLEKIPNLEVVIVGDGTAFEGIKSLTKEANEECHKEAIKLAGKRTDIYKFDNMASLFVGVSRAALEAMSCEKLVVIAGSEGFLGYLDDSNLNDAIKTNFTCRGLGISTEETLLDSILEGHKHFVEQDTVQMVKNRALVANDYSIKRMCDDAEKAYEKCLKKA